MKLGLYGGTFDPIHYGHLLLARDAVEQLGLERLVFIPNALSPHKLHWTPTPPALRLEMIRAAIAGEPRFDLDPQEVERGEISYTIDTARAYRLRYGAETELFYLIGYDNVAKLHSWHEYEELRSLVTFIVLARDGEAGSHPTLPRRIDISSTEIRNRVANGASIRYLVPETVREMIGRHQLYTDS